MCKRWYCPLCAIRSIPHTLHKMERTMSKISDKLDAVNAKVEDVAADFAAFKTAVENTDPDFSPEAQAAFDRLVASVGGLDTSVGDQDGSDTPVVPETPQDELPFDETQRF